MGKVGEGTSLDKAAKVRLDNLGLIANQSAFVNNPVRLRRLESQLRLQPTSPYHTPSGPSPKPQPNQAHPLPPYPINIPSGYTRAMTMHGRDKDSDVEKVPQTLLLAEASLTLFQMDKDFMMDLCNKLEDLVDDDNLMMEVDKTCSVTIDWTSTQTSKQQDGTSDDIRWQLYDIALKITTGNLALDAVKKAIPAVCSALVGKTGKAYIKDFETGSATRSKHFKQLDVHEIFHHLQISDKDMENFSRVAGAKGIKTSVTVCIGTTKNLTSEFIRKQAQCCSTSPQPKKISLPSTSI
ncbi:hypothetical protein THAOC_01170 [Thalassiosira oceanica]|uniref:Uncharacterized protein n=1 Tax=Thalassiosira oceanica TaxID=159749 RepID=K0TIW7_THAOC|nr:hypothetical protein THAOC_01170 [Thalassiosira oceanica]|eukprot:EJK77029.1 hypothetical protein THAOC_01170 [Thalassiosira oceanica]